MKASTSEESPSSDGAKARTGGFSSGRNTLGAGRVRVLTTFAMTPVYRKSAIGSRSKSAPLGRDTQPVDARRPTVAKIPLRYHAEGEAAPYLPEEPKPPAPRRELAKSPSTHSTGSRSEKGRARE